MLAYWLIPNRNGRPNYRAAPSNASNRGPYLLIRPTFRQRIGILTQEIERGGFFRGKLRGRHDLLGRGRGRHFGQELDVAVALEAGAGRDQAAQGQVKNRV